MATAGQITSAAGTRDVDAFTTALLNSLPPIYDRTSTDTVIYRLYRALAEQLVKADISLESVASNNYLSIPVVDELIIRSSKPEDRLQRENAFELDEIRFNPSAAQVMQNIFLKTGANVIQLLFIPSSIDFSIFDATTNQRSVSLNYPTSYDSTTNTITITSPVDGPFILVYSETGNVLRITENITIPVGLFQLGWNEGGFGDLGYGE